MITSFIPRVHLALIAGLCLMLLYPAPARTQNRGKAPDVASALAGAPAEAERHELRTTGLSAVVTVLRAGRPFPAGASAFAEITLTNTGKTRRTEAELLLEPETATIHGISGAQVAVEEDGSARIARVEKLAKGKSRTVLVEMRLREGAPAPSEKAARNKLKITLRQPGGEGEAATLGWDVVDCAAGFYAEIVKVRQGPGAGIEAAIEAAQTRDSARPGRWLFPPRIKQTANNRKCERRARRWSRTRGRYIYPCLKYEDIAPEVAGAAAPVKSEKSIFRFAARFVSSRAFDGELARTRDTGWATHRVSQNLSGFLKQNPNPAICTGAIKFLDFFDKRLEGFAKHAATFDDMAAKSWSLARLRTAEATEAAKTGPGGHPGWGAAPLDLPQGEKGTTLKAQVETLAQLTSDTELSGMVTGAESTFTALEVMSGYLKSDAAESLSTPVRTAIYRALSAIEAADYIGAVASRYVNLRGALLGSMGSLRQAHSRTCTCGG